MIAIVEAYKSGLLSLKHLKTNVMAGLIVGIVALPLAMAFAIASGVKPEQGIYTAIIAGGIVGVFGGTRVQISGPTGAFVVILAAITAKYGISGLQIATMLAGLILLLMGVLKTGSALKFIPYPVIVGFTSGIGVIIFIGQLKDFFGLPVSIAIDAPFYQKIYTTFCYFPLLDLKTTILSFLSLVIIIFSPKYIKRVPSPLLGMMIATFIQLFFNFESVATIGSVFGSIPQALPKFEFPACDQTVIFNLIGPAITIALLGAIESLLSAAAADSMTGTKHNSNKELIGQGLANFIAPLWGGFASTGAIARTVTNIRHGGNSPVSAIVHSVVLVLTVLFLAPYAVHIPFCALSAILFVVAFNMSNIPEFIGVIKRAPKFDIFVLLITFLLTIFTDLVIAVIVGVVIAILFFAFRLNQTKGEHSFRKLGKTLFKNKVITNFSDDGIICDIEGPIFFGVSEKIEKALSLTHINPKFIAFSLKKVPFIDLTGLVTFRKVVNQYQKRGIHVYLFEANKRVSKKLTKSGVLMMVTSNKIFHSLEDIKKYPGANSHNELSISKSV